MVCVLIVDDDPLVLETLQFILEAEGYDTLLARNGTEGLCRFRERRPDLVVTDLVMPDQDGFDLLRELRAEQPDVRVLVVSGGGRSRHFDNLGVARRLGAIDVLAKPFRPEDLLVRVRLALATAAAA